MHEAEHLAAERLCFACLQLVCLLQLTLCFSQSEQLQRMCLIPDAQQAVTSLAC